MSILSAVLTPHHLLAHAIHEEFFKEHMRKNGKELAAACLAIIERLSAVEALAWTARFFRPGAPRAAARPPRRRGLRAAGTEAAV